MRGILRMCVVAAAALVMASSWGCSEPPASRPLENVNTSIPEGGIEIEYTEAAPDAPKNPDDIPVQDDESTAGDK